MTVALEIYFGGAAAFPYVTVPLTAIGAVLIKKRNAWICPISGLLLVPLVLAVGGFFLTRSENRYSLKLQEQREQEGDAGKHGNIERPHLQP